MIDPLTGLPHDCREYRRRFESGGVDARSVDAGDGQGPQAHALTCASCREWAERRQVVESALRTLGKSRVAAPEVLRMRVAQVGAPEEFVGAVLRHLPPRPAPRELDEAVMGPDRILLTPAEFALTHKRILSSRRRFVLVRGPAFKLAAGLAIAVGGTLMIRDLLNTPKQRPDSNFVIVRCDPSKIPGALQASLEFLAGGVGGNRKG